MDGEFEFGKFEDLRNEADGADGEVSVTESDFVVKDVEGFHNIIEVQQWFAHSHENDVADAAIAEDLEVEVLSDDF